MLLEPNLHCRWSSPEPREWQAEPELVYTPSTAQLSPGMVPRVRSRFSRIRWIRMNFQNFSRLKFFTFRYSNDPGTLTYGLEGLLRDHLILDPRSSAILAMRFRSELWRSGGRHTQNVSDYLLLGIPSSACSDLATIALETSSLSCMKSLSCDLRAMGALRATWKIWAVCTLVHQDSCSIDKLLIYRVHHCSSRLP